MQATMTNANSRRQGRTKSKGGMGRAIRYLTHYKSQAALPYLFLIIATLSQLAVPSMIRKVIDAVKSFNDPYPYFRGLIADIGFESYKIAYKQPKRKRGLTKNNFYTLYDLAMLGITNASMAVSNNARMIQMHDDMMNRAINTLGRVA